MGRVIGQPKRLTVQARPSTTSVLLRRAIHDAVFGQAHQQVGVDACCAPGFPGRSRCRASPPAVAPSVGLGATDRRDLVQSDLGGRLRRRSAPPHLERQHPTASHSGTATNHWYDQAGTTPFCGQPGNGRYSQVRSALARAAGRGQLVPSMTHTGRPSTTRRVRQRLGEQPAQPRGVDRAIAQGVTRARPAASKHASTSCGVPTCSAVAR